MGQLSRIFILLMVCYCAVAIDWWEGGNFYQIYPRSFMDSDGDGLGDLQGIKSKVSYLKELGMDAVWLSPIMKSPMADFGYDISDYRDIYEKFGTLADFDALLAECRTQGVKLILDLVPNHTSDKHEWFKKSERREPGYENYYVWHPGTFDPVTGKRVPPNNWLSVFRYSAWTWSPIRKQFYMHAFLDKQPDLNYRNRKVVQEMKDVISFWMNKGVEGFRIDAVPYLFEVKADATGHFMDEKLANNPNCQNKDDYCYLIHSYTQDQPETYDMIFQWRKLMTDFVTKNGGETKVIMTEAYTSLDMMIKFYGENNRPGSNIPFNFELISNVNKTSTAKDYKTHIDNWINKVPVGAHANWVLGNHDNSRLATRLGVERGDLLNIMLQTLPGIAVTYQGEEMVLVNTELTWEQTVDPQACNTDKDRYEAFSRDPCRTPFPWDTTAFAGFSTVEPWLPVNPDYTTNNVKSQSDATNSHLKIFKKLTKLRKNNVLRQGQYLGALTNTDNVYIYKRWYAADIAVIILNFGSAEETVNVKTVFTNMTQTTLPVYTSSLDTAFVDGTSVDLTKVVVASNKAVVLTNVIIA